MSRDKTTVYPPREAPSLRSPPWLVVTRGRGAGQRFQLDGAEFTIGKSSDNDIVIDETGVSRHHFKVIRASDGLYNLIDLQSTNGVLVNGLRVDVAIVRDGDRIAIGPVVQMEFVLDPSAVSVEPAAVVELSARQLEVAQLVSKGLTNAMVATALEISPRTVGSHLDQIYARLEIGSRAELAQYLAKRGLV